MSTITKTWNEDKIRSIIRKLDEKPDSTELRCPSLSTVMGGSLDTTAMLNPKRLGSTVSFSTTRPPGKPR